ncbi:MAG: hypothetical protein ABW019_12015 [Chitinophagaceae bacterium]
MGRTREHKTMQRRFGPFVAANRSEYWHHFDLRPIDDLDDEAFAYILTGTGLKGITMLDLNETEITNESIRLLAGLEYVKELRAKGCRRLDNGCIKYLGQIRELEFLHLNGTGVTIDGLLQLRSPASLKTLLFQAGDPGSINQKMLQLRNLFPGCEFVVNSKPYDFSA